MNSGGCDDYAIALALAKLAEYATVSLDVRERIF